MMDAKQLYEEDFVLWSKQQADALRAAQLGGSNLELDWEHLAEEIEDLGISQRSALRSEIRRIIRHLAKLEHSPASGPRRGWVEALDDARAEVEDLLEISPSLKAELNGDVARQTARAIKLAIRDPQNYEEVDTTRLHQLRAAAYTEEQVFGDWLPAQPPR
jgi:Domain of unknown function DUF29